MVVLSALAGATAPSDPIVAPPINFSQITPILIVLTGAVLAILFEAFVPRRWRFPVQSTLAFVVVAAALVWTLIGATVIVWLVNLALDHTPGPWQITGKRRRRRR